MLGIVTKEKLERIWNCMNENPTWEEFLHSVEVVKRIEEYEAGRLRGERGTVTNDELMRRFAAQVAAEAAK